MSNEPDLTKLNISKYIFNLLLRIINVSVQTMDLINQLPELQIIE